MLWFRILFNKYQSKFSKKNQIGGLITSNKTNFNVAYVIAKNRQIKNLKEIKIYASTKCVNSV